MPAAQGYGICIEDGDSLSTPLALVNVSLHAPESHYNISPQGRTP
jgi:hypothetical protein